jgi:mannan endo-1,4-beta-mannosidase
MNRSLPTTIGLPVVALTVVGALLLVKHSIDHSAQSRRSASSGPRVKCVREPKLDGFVGIAINPPITAAIRSFATTVGVHPAIVEYYDSFGSPFQKEEARQAVASGALPFIQLNPRHAPPARIAEGAYDAYLHKFAASVKEFKCPVVLSFGHEMNGSWYPWGRPRTTPAQFIAAWRRIHDIFAREHVTNVTWAWDPDRAGSPASEWWPGSSYVNWIGLDGYERPGQTFIQIFHRQLDIISRFTRKPVFIAETGVAPSPGQAKQISALFDAENHYHLAGLVWFNINRLEPWRLQGHPAAIKAFRNSATAPKGRLNSMSTR